MGPYNLYLNWGLIISDLNLFLNKENISYYKSCDKNHEILACFLSRSCFQTEIMPFLLKHCPIKIQNLSGKL